ncbi:uncharacterized protein LOC110027910 isoform X2 [Phalaenopsis equestris]|uniref:uncharacterized protein LOC110027910 isoform X2 n=1 Tax=Phalaenopsis equestris TaxID=78828 RepID=UPI0009E32CA4|nr:uncharacterized protein LOC110027910 isoform X2 [Phalaenopsis equestris]
MDYDENDFQSQNFELVGEDKFSVNLRSFLLPRFDLDEHLSFHGLIEEQDFGIQGQENNWIDFPPGSSALEFSSSAAESCSIARHNNVWSEATSSESVDLLLKSVGEDEMINDKAVIMDTSANDESHGVDDQEVLYGGRGDSHESSMMDILHAAPEFAHDKYQKKLPGTDEGQLELLSNNAHGSFQPAEGEESRIAIYVEPSNRNHNPDEKIDVGQYKLVDIVTSLYNGIAKSKADDSDLCAVLYEKDVCEVLLKTEVPSSDESDSSVVDARSLASNQDKLDIEAEKLNTGLFGVGQDQSNIRDSSAFLCDHVHKEKSLVKHCDDKTNRQLASKSDALELLDTNCIDSVFSGNSGLVMTVPCETKSLSGNRGASEKSYAKEECMSPLAVEQVERIGNNSVILQTVPQLKEGSRSIGDSLTSDSVKDDVHGIRIQLMKNSAMSCDDRGGKLKTHIDAIDNNQDLQGELVENKNVDIAIATQLLIESPASIHANYQTRTEIKECERMSTNSLSFTCEKPGLVVEVNHDNDMDVDRQEVKLHEIKDATPDESSLPVAVIGESCQPITVTDTDSRMSPSTCCKSSLYKATVSVTDLKEVHIEQVHVSVGKETTITYIIPSKISSDPVSIVMEKARDLPPAIQDTAEGLLLKGSENKLLEEKIDFDPLSPPLEKSSSLHLLTPELATNIDLAVGKSELLIQVLSASNVIDFDNKDVKITGATASSSSTTDSIKDNESDLGSFSYPLNMRDTPSEKVSNDAQLASPVKPTDSQQSKGFNCVKDTSTDHLGNAVVQAPSLVRSVDFTQPQNDILFLAGNGVRSGKILPLEGNAVAHGSFQEGNDDIPNLLVVSHVGNEVPVASDILLTSHMNNSQICTGIIFESNSSEAQIGNSSSSERNCVLPLVINCRGCHQDYSEHQERTSSNVALVSSEKNEIIRKLHCSSKGLHVEARSSTPEASTSEDLAGAHAGSELSFLNFKAIDIPQIPNEKSQGLLEEMKVLDSSKKNSNLGKSKNASRPSNGKKTVSKGKTKREPHALKQSSAMNVKSFSSTCKSIGTLNKDIPSVEMREQSLNDHSLKTSSVGFQTSVIPDLNSSSSSTLFHQPFTDPQQVQLRAQIFVYGALISGMPPDEAYMLSAFGDSDGGRNLWEGLWHAWILRFQNRKSPVGCYDTPTQSRPGNDVQIEVPSTSATSDSISISSAAFNSTMPLPSSLRSYSYGNDGHHASISRGTYLNFSQSPSPLPHQTSVSRQHVGANSSLPSQSPRPGPWFVSSQIAPLDGIKRYSTVSVPETVHVTPVRDSCRPHRSTVEVIPLSILMSIPDTSITNTADLRKETSKRAAASGNSKYNQTTQKARKRQKSESAEGTSLPASRTLPESVSAVSDVRSLPLSSTNTHGSSNSQLNVASPTPALISAPHIVSATHYQIIDANNQQKAILSEETCSKIELARHQAEDAAALAATTVKHSQDIWSQLLSQNNFGFVSLNEEKLASAAIVAAVASSVAKAAAAAANVAVGAALQAKLMADEAVSVAKDGNTVLNSDSGVLDVGKKLVGISPVSILKGMDQIHGFGIISAASEVTRRQVDSASGATKRAENMDAIVKAAELAAEAVAQAGTIITMGDPLPFTLSQLADAGPEGFWRGHDGSFMKFFKSRITHGAENLGLVSAKEYDGSPKQLDGQFSKDEDTQKAIDEGGLSSLNEYHEQFEPRTQGTFPISGLQRVHSASSIKKGSVVEVMSDEDGRKGAWFSAQVLDINDNKAYVCYDDVSTTEGWLKEWILLEEGDKAPRIRTSHSTAFVKYEGTRKRRREHLGSYIWEIGDHVDAWIRDSWWEGTVIEKIPGDETKLTVHFAARGDNRVVHTWNLRPSRVWKDGQWMEWSHAKGKPIKPPEGDTPTEKRQRLGRSEENIHSEVDVAKMDKLSRSTIIEESRKPDDSELHVLSAKDRNFSIGKNSRAEVISDALKPKRTGLQKEGSKVVFGVPRPGKKRKFMEVSKHYVVNKSEKVSEGNDSIKFAKYLMPQVSRQSRSTSKVDNKGKNAVVIKTRGDFKAENSRTFQTGSLSEKDKASLSLSNEDVVPVHDKDVISCFTGSNNCVDNINAFKFSSFPSQAVKTDVSAVVPEDSEQSAPVPSFKKRKNSRSKMDLTEKLKFSMDGASNVGDKGSGNHGKATYEVMEPRRSNRRIQPTSRLLEGLQSSLVISKIINVSHERKPSRGGSTSKGHKLV